MQKATIELLTYVDLHDDGTLNFSVYTGNEDEPSINHNADFYNMLTDLLESHLVPADTRYIKEAEYQEFVDTVNAFQNNVIESISSIMSDAQKYRINND
jgi:lipoate-protein ligase A